jgi:hypothetical protein
MLSSLLSIITFLPLLGALALMVLTGDGLKKQVALAVSLLTFLLSLLLWTNWETGQAGMQFGEDFAWLPEIGLRYHLGVDGISLFLVLLTTFLMPIALYFSNLYVHEKVGAYLALMLMLETAMIGSFVALDMVLDSNRRVLLALVQRHAVSPTQERSRWDLPAEGLATGRRSAVSRGLGDRGACLGQLRRHVESPGANRHRGSYASRRGLPARAAGLGSHAGAARRRARANRVRFGRCRLDGAR